MSKSTSKPLPPSVSLSVINFQDAAGHPIPGLGFRSSSGLGYIDHERVVIADPSNQQEIVREAQVQLRKIVRFYYGWDWDGL